MPGILFLDGFYRGSGEKMYKDKVISLVVPCYNEEDGLKAMFPKVPLFIDEVIVVDNNSTDHTLEVACRYHAKVIQEKRKGYGYAIKAGLARSRGDILVVLDGDDSYPLGEIEKLLDFLMTHKKDFVSGCRYPLQEKDAHPPLNTIANTFITWLSNVLFSIQLKDSLSGMWVFKREAFNSLNIQSNGMSFTQEIKIRTLLAPDINFAEAHIAYAPRKGDVKFKKGKDSFWIFLNLVLLRLELCKK